MENNFEKAILTEEQKAKGILRIETREEYFERLLKAIDNINNDVNVVHFTPEGLEEFRKSLLNEK